MAKADYRSYNLQLSLLEGEYTEHVTISKYGTTVACKAERQGRQQPIVLE
jgi:hypothetical protein